MQKKQREHWGSQLGFILVAAGSAIGLGTLWKFPYVTGQNGGGLFVILYILCTFLIAVPVFMAELAIGRSAQRGAVGSFGYHTSNNTFWKAVGWMGVAASFLIMSYYSVLAGWGMNYVLMSLNQAFNGKSSLQIAETFNLIAQSGDITLFWHAAFTALCVMVVYPGVRQGIEFWSKFMTSSLLVILLGLTCYSMTLPGLDQALHFLFYPDVSKLTSLGILQALGLSFFTLSLGQGIMITYGSYMKESENIPKISLVVGVSIVCISMLVGLMLFPIIFTFGVEPQAGTGLAFQTLPILFEQLPMGQLLSILFFTLFVFTGLTSAIALVEVVSANFIDLLGWTRKKAVVVTGVSAFIFGIPSSLSETNWIFANWKIIYGKTFFATIDGLVSDWFLPFGGFLTAIFAGWYLDNKMIEEEVSRGSSFKYLIYVWRFLIRYLAPIAVFWIIINQFTG